MNIMQQKKMWHFSSLEYKGCRYGVSVLSLVEGIKGNNKN